MSQTSTCQMCTKALKVLGNTQHVIVLSVGASIRIMTRPHIVIAVLAPAALHSTCQLATIKSYWMLNAVTGQNPLRFNIIRNF